MLELNKIYNMDCIEGLKLIDNNSVDLVLTDPPYNTGIKKTNGKGRLCNFFMDDYNEEDYLNLVKNYIKECFRILKFDRAIYIYINWKSLGLWLDIMEEEGFNIKNVIVWDKMVHGLNYQNYAYTYELIIYATKGYFYPTNKTIKDNNYGFYKDIWHIQRDINTDVNSEHETVKQIEVIRLPIQHTTKEGDIVFDGFMGTGTTAVACKQLNRRYIGFEISPEYCKIAEKRLNQKTLMEVLENETTGKDKGIYEEQGESSCERDSSRFDNEHKLSEGSNQSLGD